MNSFYVTVSIPLLLVLAGFNHAHGLTTFGKTQSNPSNNQPQTPSRPCFNHTLCVGIPGTSCVPDPRDNNKKSCLCGDNQSPINGGCRTDFRGPKHLCENNEQCVNHSKCEPAGKNGASGEMVCKCLEGFIDVNNQCNGGLPTHVGSAVVLIVSVIANAVVTF